MLTTLCKSNNSSLNFYTFETEQIYIEIVCKITPPTSPFRFVSFRKVHLAHKEYAKFVIYVCRVPSETV